MNSIITIITASDRYSIFGHTPPHDVTMFISLARYSSSAYQFLSIVLPARFRRAARSSIQYLVPILNIGLKLTPPGFFTVYNMRLSDHPTRTCPLTMTKLRIRNLVTQRISNCGQLFDDQQHKILEQVFA